MLEDCSINSFKHEEYFKYYASCFKSDLTSCFESNFLFLIISRFFKILRDYLENLELKLIVNLRLDFYQVEFITSSTKIRCFSVFTQIEVKTFSFLSSSDF